MGMVRASDLSPEYVVMGYLSEEPSYGYQLHQQAERDFSGIWRMSQSQCYNILNRLEAQRDISGNMITQESGREKRLFQLTAPGRKRFNAWLDSPTPASARAIRVEFLARLFFALRNQAQNPMTMIGEQQAELNTAIDRLDHEMSALDEESVFQRLSLQLRLEQLRSCTAWLDDCKSALAETYITRKENPDGS